MRPKKKHERKIRHRPGENSMYRYDGLLSETGQKYCNIARLVAHTGDWIMSIYKVTGKRPGHNTAYQMKKHPFMRRKVREYVDEIIEEHNLDKEAFIAKVERTIDVTLDKLEDADPKDVPRIIDKLTDLYDMVGGDWNQLSTRQEGNKSFALPYSDTRYLTEVTSVESKG